MNFIEIFGRMSDKKTKRPLAVDADGRLAYPVVEETLRPFGKGALTSNGVQTSNYYTTTSALNTNEVVEQVTAVTALPGKILDIEFSLTLGINTATSITADPIYQWQAKSVESSTWVNLHSAVTKTNVGTTEVIETYSGRFATINSDGALPEFLARCPIQIRLLIQSNEASEGKARTYNSSSVIIRYIPD